MARICLLSPHPGGCRADEWCRLVQPSQAHDSESVTGSASARVAVLPERVAPSCGGPDGIRTRDPLRSLILGASARPRPDVGMREAQCSARLSYRSTLLPGMHRISVVLSEPRAARTMVPLVWPRGLG